MKITNITFIICLQKLTLEDKQTAHGTDDFDTA